MKCPFCGKDNTRVIDSRPADDGASIRRRRQCDVCLKRFTTYEKVEAISIDKGILEKSKHIKMIKGEFKWLDIGSIKDFFKIQENDLDNNVKKGNIIDKDIENCNVYNDDNNILIAIVGTKGLNIIKSNNVILIADKDKMGELPNLIEKIKGDKKLENYI